MTIRVVLVDDEAPARSELRFLLEHRPGIEVVGEAAGAAEALELVRSVRPDAVFLDIEMPGLTGLEAAGLVRDSRDAPAVVFVTAHERYALEAFAVEAFDYLLKPVDPERLARVVARLRERSPAVSPQPVARVAVVSGTGTELLDYDQIHYAQADGDYSRVHTYDRAFLCTASLGELERQLPATRFARVHRSYLVNLAKVAAVRRAGPDHIRLELADASRTELGVARRQARRLRERLGI
jgi:two-component system, LytTR family, response regulator LytT